MENQICIWCEKPRKRSEFTKRYTTICYHCSGDKGKRLGQKYDIHNTQKIRKFYKQVTPEIEEKAIDNSQNFDHFVENANS